MKKKVLLGLIVVLLIGTMLIQTPQAVLIDPEDVSVLIILGHGFGWSYFEFLNVFEAWGCAITTTGNTSHVESCANKIDRSVDVDILISEIDREDLSQYDVLIVPSGGHWYNLSHTEETLTLIQMAYEEGLIVSGICIGVVPLAVANVTEGKIVAGHNLCYPYVHDSGGTMNPFMRVITDGNLITGDNGGGVPNGYETAPHYELCVTILKHLSNYSYYEEMVVQPTIEGTDIVYYMSVTTSGPINLFGDVTTPEIAEVEVNLHEPGNDTVIESFDLTDDDSDSVFIGSYTDLNISEYVVDLHITDANVSMEVVKSVTPFIAETVTRTTITTTTTTATTSSVPSTTTNSTSTSDTTSGSSLVMESVAVIGAVGCAVVVLVIVLKRKTSP